MLLPRAARLSRTSPLLRRAMSSTAAPVSLLTPAELSKLLASSAPPVVLDASWHMPGAARFPFAEYRHKRIAGAGFWDVDQIASTSERGVPHNMPQKALFEDACSRLAIRRDDHVVLYDTVGVFSAPRTAFTFKHFGHERVSILDGGLPRWQAEGHPIDTERPTNPNPHAVEEGTTAAAAAQFRPILSELLWAHKPRIESYFIADIEEEFTEYKVEGEERDDVRQWEDVDANIEKGEDGAVVVDARPPGRFHGTDPEPREGLSSGHMPHAISLPFSSVLSAESSTEPPYKTLLPPAELEKVFVAALGEEKWAAVKRGERPVIGTCGSGMTAAVLWLALQRAGAPPIDIYDESWTGYAQNPKSKIVKD
ncbi:hypothetical protein JCM10450v2_005383 [Rhodotorula kratochvilovae]